MTSEVQSLIELYDSDILKIEGVLQALNEKVGTRRVAEDYRREIIGRFEEIGLVVTVTPLVPADPCIACAGQGKSLLGTECSVCGGSGGVASARQPEFVSFGISITDRTEPKPFDYERQAHEVTADILDLGTGGPIKG